MSVSDHYSAIWQLMPVDLGPKMNIILQVAAEGDNAVEESAIATRLEFFADTATLTIDDWERIVGIKSDPSVALQARQDAVVARLRAIGPKTPQDFIDLAAYMGYTITIREYKPARAGQLRAGDQLFPAAAYAVWEVTLDTQSLFRFRAGQSRVGEKLVFVTDQNSLEAIFNIWKPAHTVINFVYP